MYSINLNCILFLDVNSLDHVPIYVLSTSSFVINIYATTFIILFSLSALISISL